MACIHVNTRAMWNWQDNVRGRPIEGNKALCWLDRLVIVDADIVSIQARSSLEVVMVTVEEKRARSLRRLSGHGRNLMRILEAEMKQNDK